PRKGIISCETNNTLLLSINTSRYTLGFNQSAKIIKKTKLISKLRDNGLLTKMVLFCSTGHNAFAGIQSGLHTKKQ
ncbi:MAG TPA: hypothetical protein PLM05_11525, partial [Bacteroidales bacterium]|nr:hypothetical protein [Bacteroidales bacterium]